MKAEKVIPVLRIFDYNKAIEFYIDWLGFKKSILNIRFMKARRNMWKWKEMELSCI